VEAQRVGGKLYKSHIGFVSFLTMKTDAVPAPSLPVVLIADDDVDVRSSLEEGLREAGYHPHCVRNGDEALAYLRRNPPPSAILLDLFMPVMNGWQFVHNLRGTRLDVIPIILVTGSEKYWGSPVARVLRKPLDLGDVIHALGEVVPPGSGATA
jgi:CheY-like chemotaxis protein